MPKSNLSIIYGIDETSDASDCADDALRNTRGQEEFWGGSWKDESAKGKGNYPDPAPITTKDDGSDSRAKTQSNH